MPLNECYKPVITLAKGILLKYTLLEDEQGQKILQLIPPNREIKQSEKKLFDSIQAPIGRRCKKFIGDNKDLKKCLSRDVQKYIARSFDKDIIKKLKARGLKCSNRSYVSFYYNQEGKPEEVKAISAYPLLEKEVIRIVKGLPKVKPGMKNGKPVRVRFMLPIVLQL